MRQQGTKKKIGSSSNEGETKGATYSEHMWDMNRLEKELETSLSVDEPEKSAGLTEYDAKERLERDGPNQLTPPVTKNLLQRVVSAILDPFKMLLLGASLLCFLAFLLDTSDLTNLYLAVALVIIVALTVALTIYQEGQAADVMKNFMNLLPPSVIVRRDGQTSNIESTELVVGDVVVINTGDKIPADMRLLHVSQLKIDHSSLTGESIPVSMQVEPDDDDFLEAKNIAFSGTLVTAGLGCGVVIRTADRTYVGSIARLASGTSTKKSTLTREIEAFVRFIAMLSITMAVVLSTVTLVRKGLSLETVLDALVRVFIVCIVSNVPQGLPSAVVGALTVAAKKLGRKNVFVKSLNSIETLGSVSVIASDKTGTLTQNKMTVTSVWCDASTHSADGQDLDEDQPSADNDSTQVKAAKSLSIELKHRSSSALTDFQFENGFEVMVLSSALCNQATRVQDSHHSTMSRMPTVVFGVDEDIDEDVYGIKREKTLSLVFQGRPMPGSALSLDARNYNYQKTIKSTMSIRDERCSMTEPIYSGNASDIALYQFAEKHHNVKQCRALWPTMFQVPFSSSRKWMLTVHRAPSESVGNKRIVLIKGAPERILMRCDKMMVGSQIESISDDNRKGFRNAIDSYMKRGRRVLAMAFSIVEIPQDFVDNQNESEYFEKEFSNGNLVGDPESVECKSSMTLIGCAALEDPPKESVPAAILKCRAAGIRVVMVTGDHPATASSIARQCNIMGRFKTREEAQEANGQSQVDEKQIGAVVVTGNELRSFTDVDWDRVLSKPEIVFARTSPLDKLTIVEQFQKRGEVVAVTGDGVNDSPALKKADVGVAMGVGGSEVAKDAGTIVLMDDEFLSLVVGIEEGRIIFDNLIKVIAYTLSHLMPELVAVIIAILFDTPFGMTSLMILLIDLGTEIAPSLSLAYEGSEENIMKRPPRNLLVDRLVSKSMLAYAYLIAGVIETLACLAAFVGVFLHFDARLSDVFFSDYFKEDSQPLETSNGKTISPERQLEIAAIAQSAYFCTLVLSQLWHVWMCKTRFVSVSKHGLFGNRYMNMGTAFTICIMLVTVLLPGFVDVVGSRFDLSVTWLFIVPSLFSFVSLLTHNEGRKYFMRNYPEATLTKYFAF